MKRLSCFAIGKAASVCSMIGAHTAGLRSVTVVSKRGIACPYHGWLYDTRGNCLETPAGTVREQVSPDRKQKLLSGAKARGTLLGIWVRSHCR